MSKIGTIRKVIPASAAYQDQAQVALARALPNTAPGEVEFSHVVYTLRDEDRGEPDASLPGLCMALTDVGLSLDSEAPPADVLALLREADRRIEEFQRDGRVPGFVPSDFSRAYRVLRAVAATSLAPGSLFCEWGSGFGVISCLAAMLEFDAIGIEIDDDLVDAAQQLADDFELPVEFIRGSFLPAGCKVDAKERDGFAWLATDERRPTQERELEPSDFDVIFAYPWPDEEDATAAIFDRYASKGAILITYHGGDEFRARRKTRRK
ncbi:MAG: hypothetical protein EXR98_11235 [Gemmataceae bacterium]|nr:hypothetical protein [Gemmataceae bacterium]